VRSVPENPPRCAAGIRSFEGADRCAWLLCGCARRRGVRHCSAVDRITGYLLTGMADGGMGRERRGRQLEVTRNS